MNNKLILINYLRVVLFELKDEGEGFDELATNAFKQCLNTTSLLEASEDTLIQLDNQVKDDLSGYTINGVMLDPEDKNHVLLTITDDNDELQTIEITDVSRRTIFKTIGVIYHQIQH